MSAPGRFGKSLYGILPAVYRERDNAVRDESGTVVQPGDLEKLLAGFGVLLDRVHETLEQRLADSFPQGALTRKPQTWLLPYFARLLDVPLVSPDEDGQHAEISRAVAWRQGKGTLPTIEEIAQAVSEIEFETQEGWRKTATTVRVGDPLVSAIALGEAREIPEDASMADRARHPGLPAVTIDLRYGSRAMKTDANNPAVRRTVFAGETEEWRQVNRHGTPLLPGTYQDVARRTVDVRTPDWRRGHAHPRRLALFYPPHPGFCNENPVTMNWSTIQNETDFENDKVRIRSEEVSRAGGVITRRTVRGKTPEPLRIRGVVQLQSAMVYRFENVWIANQVTVDEGFLELDRAAARWVTVETAGTDEPVLDARSTLISRLDVPAGLARLEYVTVLRRTRVEALQASDCIFSMRPRTARAATDIPGSGCIRYSRLPRIPEHRRVTDGAPSKLKIHDSSCTNDSPWFFEDQFGRPGCGVLHPGGSPRVRFGAEDGGEMGVYHEDRHVLRLQAVGDKLRHYLPLGIEAVLVPDTTLLCAPPEQI